MTCMGLILSGCAVSPGGPPEAESYELRHEGERIIYRGRMSAAANEEIAALLQQHPGQIEWLEIESPGGEVMLGLDLGDLVLEHELAVKVIDTGCHSSCANYVFTAGRQKVISEGSLVTWHGSALQRSLERSTRWRSIFRPSLRRSFEEWKARQKVFFQRIGVDERITIVGQDLKCGCIWALSAQDMARFGLDAEVPANYTDTNVSEVYGDHRAKLLALPDDVFERIRPREDA
jgi:hypothetical protein